MMLSGLIYLKEGSCCCLVTSFSVWVSTKVSLMHQTFVTLMAKLNNRVAAGAV